MPVFPSLYLYGQGLGQGLLRRDRNGNAFQKPEVRKEVRSKGRGLRFVICFNVIEGGISNEKNSFRFSLSDNNC